MVREIEVPITVTYDDVDEAFTVNVNGGDTAIDAASLPQVAAIVSTFFEMALGIEA
jgi:hypothetical protein